MDLRLVLEQRFLAPVVVVAASPEVELASEKNGLIFQQLLAPFAKCANDIYARIGDRSESSVIRRFALRLYRPDNLRELEPKLRMEHFTQLLRDHAQLELAYGEQLDPVLVSIIQSATPVEPMLDTRSASTLLERSSSQWADQFILDYLNMVRCSYFDTVDHPVGYIVAVSASLTPAAVFEQVATLEARARATRDGVPPMDDDPHVYILVVHDRSASTSSMDAERTFGDVQLRYPGRCALVHINSSPAPRRQCDPSPFVESNSAVDCYATNGTGKRYRRVEAMFPAAVSGADEAAAVNGMLVTGCFLSNEDLAELRSAMSFYISQSLMPHMERKLRILFQSVNEKRQSTLSKVAAWFKKDDAKPKSELFVLSQEPGVPAKYLYGALEIQMRRAGDLCMYLRDFDTAATYFRMCRDELQGTVAQRDFNKQLIAAAQDAIGLSLYFQGKLPMPCNPRNDCRLELAREEYTKAAVHSYAFRTSLILYLMCKLRSPPAHDKASQVLQTILRAPGGINANKLYAPVLHEMCAAVALVTNPPSAATQGVVVPPGHPTMCNVRKYARLLCVAGSNYAEAGLPEMALRSYLRALRVFSRSVSATSFQYIFEHVHVAVAQLLVKCGRSTKSIGCFTVLMLHGSPQLASPTGSARMLDIYTKSLVNWMSEHERSIVPFLAAPAFQVESIRIAHAGTAAATSDEATEQEERQLGEVVAMEWAVLDDACKSFYGEKTQLTLPVKSPLTAPFPTATVAVQPGAAGSKKSAAAAAHAASLGELFTVTILAINPLGVPVTAQDVALLFFPFSGGEPAGGAFCRGISVPSVTIPALRSERVALSISPEEGGDYGIVGLSWTVCGIPGQLLFSACEAVKGYRETVFEFAAENSSASAQMTNAVDPAKTIRVTFGPPVARLSASLDPPLPSVVRNGQYVRTNIVLENHSSCCTASSVLLARSPSNAHLTYFPSFSAAENSENFSRPFVLPPIEPGQKVSIPVVYRAQYAGRLSRCINNVMFSVSYFPHAAPADGQSSAGPRRVRLVRFLRRVVVRPILNINSIVSLGGEGKEGLAAVTLLVCNVGQRGDAPVIVSRIFASHSPAWRLRALNPGNALRDSAVDCVVGVDSSFAFAMTLSRESAADATSRDTELMALTTPGADHRRKGELQALGSSIASDEANLFFSTKAHVGAGALGETGSCGGDDFSFYLDKAGTRKSEQELRQERWAAETELYGAPLRQYPPVLLSVAWRCDEDGSHTVYGQLFHFVDVAGRLLRPLATRDWIVKNVPTLTSVPASLAQPGYFSALADAFRASDTVSESSRANLIVHCDRPRRVQNTPASPHVAYVHLNVRFRCMCAVPLRVETAFREPQFSPFSSQHGRTLFFSGKTKVKFVVLPDEEFTVTVVGSAASPGLYNCNTMEVTAVPVKFSPCLRTGTTTCATDAIEEVKGGLFEKLAVLGTETAWPCIVEFAHTTRNVDLGDFSGCVVPSASTHITTSQHATVKATVSPSHPTATPSEPRDRSVSTIVRRARGTSLIQATLPGTIAGSRNSVRRSDHIDPNSVSTPQLSHSFASPFYTNNDSGLQEHTAGLHGNSSFTAGIAAALQEPSTNDGIDMGDEMPPSGSQPDSRSPEPSAEPCSPGPAPGTVVEVAPVTACSETPSTATAPLDAMSSPLAAVLYSSPAASPKPPRKRRNVFEDSSSASESDVANNPLGPAQETVRAGKSEARQAASVDDHDEDDEDGTDPAVPE
jgi:hypothetical protein